MLGPFRALDLTDEKGFLCGKILADLGADVVKIEPIGGDRARRFGPFYRDRAEPESSLFWLAYNCNKRGITLNISSRDGRAILKELVRGADFLIESFAPGHMEELGIPYDELRQVNPGIIMASITPFGQTGPYCHYKATDLVGMALAGTMYVNGFPDREPIRYGFPLSYCHAAADAAVACLTALYHRQVTGRGQYIDVSMQQSVLGTLHNTLQLWDLEKVNQNRCGISFRVMPEPTMGMRAIWPCKDGHISFILFGAQIGAKSNPPLIRWMDEEGMCPAFLREIEWADLELTEIPKEILEIADKAMSDFFLSHTKEELYDGAIKRRIFLYPVSDPRDILHDAQLRERNFWVNLHQKAIDRTVSYPGPFVKASETPLKIERPAPRVGEHNVEIYEQELGYSRKQMLMLKETGVL